MNEPDFEPVRGLPGPLPPGEHILWQGAPRWRSIARRVFHIRFIAAYFAALMAWRIGAVWNDGAALGDALISVVPLMPLAAASLGLLALIAWGVERTTVYTITTRRVVMRIGVALQVTVNIPFAIIASAALKSFPDKTGDIPLVLTGNGRMAYLKLWPHARPWRIARPEPMLRCVPDAAGIAGVLSEALAQHKVASGAAEAQAAAKPALRVAGQNDSAAVAA